MYERIIHELKHHIPFTLFGALTGIIAVFFTHRISHETAHTLFYVIHPAHVVLSALVTASIYKLYRCGNLGHKCNIWVLLSTWASLFHILMAINGTISFVTAAVIFVFLFLSVWMPCCFSDIVFPLLFVGEKNNNIIEWLWRIIFLRLES